VGGLRSRHGVLTVSLLRRDMVCRGFSVLGDLARRFCCLFFAEVWMGYCMLCLSFLIEHVFPVRVPV
jgi:hypothetical protein